VLEKSIYRTSPKQFTIIVLAISTFIVLAYMIWVIGFRVIPEFDMAISSWALITLLLLAILLGLFLWLQKSKDINIRRGWTFITIAVISKLIGEILNYFHTVSLNSGPPSRIGDIFLILFYPLFFIGVINFPFKPLKRQDYLLFLLDLAIVLVTVGMIFWFYILTPILNSQDSGFMKFINMAYPTGDLILLAGLLIINQREIHKFNRASLVFLIVSILLASIPDAIFSYIETNKIPTNMSDLNIFWQASVLCLIYATAMQIISPSTVTEQSNPEEIYNPKLQRLLPPYLAATIGPVLMVGIVNPNNICQPQFRGLLEGIILLIVLVFARQHIVLMDNIRLYKFTRKQATIDGLTQVYNRQYLNEVFPVEVEEAKKYANKLSVLLIDVDGFKSFNDTFGHVTGDKVLKMIANILSSQIRRSDILARYGGDEFAIILKDTDLESAKIVSDKIQNAVASQSIAERPLGVSVGEAQLIGDQTPEQMLEEADRDLYNDKALKKVKR